MLTRGDGTSIVRVIATNKLIGFWLLGWCVSAAFPAQALKKQHEAFESDLAAHEDRIEQLNQIVQELT